MLLLLCVSQFVMILDSTVMNVSISTVASDLGTTITGMQAAITFYALTMAAFMLTGGKLGDRWGRARAFRIGAVAYGVGSLTTALSPNLTVLMLGWSLVEGLGAVLVIPAIAALAAVNYSGRERVVAFSALGAATGIAAAAGPLIGGLVTTYASWRFVFAAETIVMIVVLLLSGRIKDAAREDAVRIDLGSVILSAGGMALLVFAVLQSKSWGWIVPLDPPVVGGVAIAPFGVSPVAYLILLAIVVLWLFVRRQRHLERTGGSPLLKVGLLGIPALRSGLAMFLSQYFAIAALFFVVPVYLQTIQGYDALQTGLRILPLSLGLILFSVVGSRLSTVRSPRQIARWGQGVLALGVLLVFAAVQPDLAGVIFAIGMFIVGSGFGLLASQLLVRHGPGRIGVHPAAHLGLHRRDREQRPALQHPSAGGRRHRDGHADPVAGRGRAGARGGRGDAGRGRADRPDLRRDAGRLATAGAVPRVRPRGGRPHALARPAP
ncbi:hypothetical protein GCM10010461_16230 [Microbacterium aurantiacum]